MTHQTNLEESTKSSYIRRAEQLIRAFERETSRALADDPYAMLKWFAAKTPTLRKTSFRLYKASLVYYFNLHGPGELAQRIDAIPGSMAALNIRKHKTSSDKLKHVPLDIFYAIIVELANSRSEYSDILACWITCNSVLGLRPEEWKSAVLSEDTLICRNAKFTHGRGRFGNRTLELRNVMPYVLDATRKFIHERDSLISRGASFKVIYTGCRQLLLRVQNKLFPRARRRLSLYSTRHQSIANAKFGGLTREEIAVMYGHSSHETAISHYAQKKYGRGFFMLRGRDALPRASEEQGVTMSATAING